MSVTVPKDPERKKEKGERKRKHREADLQPLSTNADGEGAGEGEGGEKLKTKKKKKSKVVDPEEGVDADGDVEMAVEEGSRESKNSKKRKTKKDESKDSEEVVVDEVVGEAAPADDQGEPLKKKKKKSKSAPGDDVDADSSMVGVVEGSPDKKKKKKRRVKDAAGEAEGDGGDDEVEAAKPKEKRSKKSKKHDQECPDPAKDESLSDQGRKAIAYAISYHLSQADPASGLWKFNKARQNWIMRNICDPSAIPDPYFSYATEYVQSIKGGAKVSLLKSCHAILCPPPPTESIAETKETKDDSTEKATVPRSESESESETTGATKSTKVVEAVPPATATGIAPPLSEEADKKMSTERARILIDSL